MRGSNNALQRDRRWRRSAAALACGAVLAGAAAIGTTSSAQASDDSDTLVAAMDSSGIDNLNPFLGYFNGALDTFGLIYPSLNSLDAEGKPQPYLAESWTTSDDKLTWTFKIKQGLTWSDGEPITAADAAWTLNLIMTDEVAGTSNGAFVENFEEVSAPDDSTLVITTEKPQSNMLTVSVPVAGIPIVPQHVWEPHVADLADYKNDDFPIVGYGPFELVDYAPEQFEKFDANPDFALGDLGAPAYDHLILQVFKNSDAAVGALQSNQISYLTNMVSTQYEALKSSADVEAVQAVGDGWTAVEVNSGAATRDGTPIGTGNPILADDQVRLAINYGIDKDKLVSNVLGGLGVVGDGYLPPAWPQWEWSPAEEDQVSFDPDRANEILDAAGYPKGSDGIRAAASGEKLAFRFGIHADNTRDSQIAQFMTGWMKDIGIDLEIEVLSMTKLNDNLAKGDWDMLMDSWTTGPDPTYLLSIQTCDARPNENGQGGSTDSFTCIPAYDELFAQQVTEFDQAKRAEVIGEMQDILYQANNDIILYYANRFAAYRSDVVQDVVTGSANDEGLYPAQSAFTSYLLAKPAAGAEEADEASNAGMYAGIGAAALVVIGAGVVLRRRASAGDRE